MVILRDIKFDEIKVFKYKCDCGENFILNLVFFVILVLILLSNNLILDLFVCLSNDDLLISKLLLVNIDDVILYEIV